MKVCAKCCTKKPLDQFHNNRRSKDGKKSRCKPCNTADAAAWQVENKERYLMRYYKWAQQNRDKTRRAAREWNKRHSGAHHSRQVVIHGRDVLRQRSRSWAEKNRDRSRSMKRAWKKSNPEWVSVSAAKRRAAQLNAIPKWADLEAIKRIYERARKLGMHVDHIVPLVSKYVCGLHVENNLQIISPAENYAKNNRHWPDMWESCADGATLSIPRPRQAPTRPSQGRGVRPASSDRSQSVRTETGTYP